MDADKEKRVCDFIGIDHIYEHQSKAINSILQKKDVIVSTKTSSGKSLCYQAIPVVNKGQNVLVFSPLVSIMAVQTTFLQALGLNCITLGKSSDEDKFRNGEFDVAFTSPESVLNNKRLSDAVMSDQVRSRLCSIVVDEAHTIIQWGQAKKDDTPFREWFDRIGEIRSLCPCVPLLVLTATASKRNRQIISKSLSLKSAVEILESPDRPNIKLNVKHIKSNEEIYVSMKWILQGLKKSARNFPKHVVFCKTIRECAKVYTALRMNVPSCRDFFQMYHSCTPKDVKEAICVRKMALSVYLCALTQQELG